MSTMEMADAALSEREKMIKGLPYDAMKDDDLVLGRLRAKRLCRAYNEAPLASLDDPKGGLSEEQRAIIAELFDVSAEKAQSIYMEAPIQVDYGVHTTFLGDFYSNYNLILLDCSKVTFGSRVVLAPSVSIYAATHSAIDVEERRNGLELAFPVTIGNDVWIGGNVCIIGPVTIGDGATVAAGSVVVRDVEPFTVVGGNPARLLKRVPPVPPRPGDPVTVMPTIRPGRGS